MAIFGMVTTARSGRYTEHALRSFFRNTPLGPQDEFYLFDNDGACSTRDALAHPRVRLIRNSAPRSFAANVNRALAIAAARGADLYFLNNDLILTEGWIEPLAREREPAVLSPVSNADVRYEHGGFVTGFCVDLGSYLGHEPDLDRIAELHRSRARGLRPVLRLSFYCVKIPRGVYSVLGGLDERFGAGGAEDDDYCLRAALAGFPVRFAEASYVLHFGGKSTWASGERPEATSERNATYIHAFRAKWGDTLLEAFVYRNPDRAFGRHAEAREAYQAREYGLAARRVLERERPGVPVESLVRAEVPGLVPTAALAAPAGAAAAATPALTPAPA